jgi:prepilin-type N-terminal cleavage/methylation domain-containing protein/prepilin-type processing-associated H-X9-DG protein
MKKNRCISRLRLGFTLVELLVVIAIIAVLATLGFMGARKMIDSASKTKSMGNIKQLILAFHQYSNDQNGMIMHWNETESTIGGVTAKRNWSQNMLLTLSPDLASNNGSIQDTYAREIGIFADPKALKQAKTQLPKSGPNSWRTYAYNNRIGVPKVDFSGQIPYAQGAKRVNQVDSPNKLVLLSQRILTGYYHSYLQPEDGSNSAVDFNLYKNSSMVGFLDGHVEWFTKKNYPSWSGISPRTGKAYTNAEMDVLWFGRSPKFDAP